MAGFSEHRLLVIDDDELFLEIARFNLDKAGYDVEVASDPHVGLNRAIELQFDLILLDLMMPGLDGEEVLSLLKPLNQQRIVVVSGHTGNAYRSRARDLGAVGYLEKPVTAQKLCETVKEILSDADRGSDGDGGDVFDQALDLPVRWVFGVGAITLSKRIVAWFVLLGLVTIFAWLVTF
ncbi:MAG: response regulator [Candidatus Latescibacteria bacterium]|jgi:DNA-binding response OmpR family regulator|nr:response regulator [Candidatus Latescibacterota bacterium]MBT4140630.1 response regulator [Candidatus Latescibacterota bacterium]